MPGPCCGRCAPRRRRSRPGSASWRATTVSCASSTRRRRCARGCGGLQQEIHDHLEATLREEAGASDGAPLPGLIAGQISWIHQTVFVGVGREMLKGCNPDEVPRQMLVLLDDNEELLSEKVLNYAVRGVE